MADPESPTEHDSATENMEPHQTQPKPQTLVDDVADKLNNISFKIWPPKQRTRDAVLNRLVETLSSESVLSKRYGTIPKQEASAAAKLIEQEAFSVAGESFSTDEDGIEILQVYSKEISKRMLETVKARSAVSSGDSAPSGSEEVDSNNVGTAADVEDSFSSVKAED